MSNKFLDAVMVRRNEEMMLSLRFNEPRPQRVKPEKKPRVRKPRVRKSRAKKWFTPPKFERRPYPGAGIRAEKLKRKLGFNEFNRRVQCENSSR